MRVFFCCYACVPQTKRKQSLVCRASTSVNQHRVHRRYAPCEPLHHKHTSYLIRPAYLAVHRAICIPRIRTVRIRVCCCTYVHTHIYTHTHTYACCAGYPHTHRTTNTQTQSMPGKCRPCMHSSIRMLVCLQTMTRKLLLLTLLLGTIPSISKAVRSLLKNDKGEPFWKDKTVQFAQWYECTCLHVLLVYCIYVHIVYIHNERPARHANVAYEHNACMSGLLLVVNLRRYVLPAPYHDTMSPCAPPHVNSSAPHCQQWFATLCILCVRSLCLSFSHG